MPPPDTSPVTELRTGDKVDAAVAGLDALDIPISDPIRTGHARLLGIAGRVLPPFAVIAALVGIWQALWAAAIWPEYQLPAPAAVWAQIAERIPTGEIAGFLWVSVHRAVIGFLFALTVAVPLGLIIANIQLIRRGIGPLVTGLQSLPSVAWVPAAVLWFGLTDSSVYVVVLLGAVPSIANGLVSGIDQIPPILPRVGKVLGAGRLAGVRHILLPAALPGFLGGLKQGWAFSWRSLMAAELIAQSPQLGTGLGQFLHNGSSLNDMSMVMAAIMLIFFVGVGIELLVFRPLERAVLHARGLTGSL